MILSQANDPDYSTFYAFIEVKKDGEVIRRCAGAIASRYWVVTSAHCLTNQNEIEIHFGSLNAEKHDENGGTTMTLNAEHYHIHPDFDPETLANDIAVIRVPKVIRFNDTIKSIKKPDEHERDNLEVLVIGSGRTNPVLHWAPMEIMTDNEFDEKYPLLKGRRLLGVNGTGIDAVDYGSLLIRKDDRKLIGIATHNLSGITSYYEI